MTDAYNAILTKATAQGSTESFSGAFGALQALPLGYYAFVGYSYMVYIGAEVKEPQKSMSRATVLALILTFVYYVAFLGAYYNVVGQQFNDAVAYLTGVGANPIPVTPSLGLFAGLLSGNPTVTILMFVSFFIWSYLGVVAIAGICVRNMFAWSFDQVFPAKISAVTKGGSPWAATLVTIVAAEVFVILYVFTTIFTLVANYTIMYSIAFLITSIAAIVFPYRRRDLFDAAPEAVRRKFAGLPFVTIAGIIATVMFVFAIYEAWSLPALSGPTGVVPALFIIGMFATGFVGYYIARAYRMRKGVNLDLLFKEVPPE